MSCLLGTMRGLPCLLTGAAALVGLAGPVAAAQQAPAAPLPAQPAPAQPDAQTIPDTSAASGAQTIAGAVTLAAETQQAFVRNPLMVQAAQKLHASQARLSEELALRFPQYGLTTSLTGVEASGYGAFPTLNTVLSVPLDTAGKNGQLIRQARSDLDAAQTGFRRSASDLAYQVATAYAGALRTAEESSIAEDTYNQAQAQQQAAQKRLAAGDVPRTDVLKAEVQVSQARSDWLLAESAAAQARATLNNAAGFSLETPVSLAGEGSLESAPPGAEVMRARVDASPEVRSAQDAVTSAEAGVALADVEGRPAFSVQGTYTHTGDPTTYANALGAGVSVTIPLPDGGVRRSHHVEAEAALLGARSVLTTVRNQALLDLQTAYLALDDARQRFDITGQGVALATESLRAANLGYANGVSTARDVIDAQVALRAARIQNTEAIYAYNLAVARIYNVLGDAQPGITLPATAVVVAGLSQAGGETAMFQGKRAAHP